MYICLYNSFTIVLTDVDRVMIYGTVMIIHELMDPKKYDDDNNNNTDKSLKKDSIW